MTATSQSRRASKDVQSRTLGTALRGLGRALGTTATPRLEFQRDLRERLIEEARLLALQPKPPPRARRPRRPRGGGIRLAAIGIGFSLAGGGIVAAAHSFSLPARVTAPVSTSTPGGPSASPSPSVSGPQALPAAPLQPEVGASRAPAKALPLPTTAGPTLGVPPTPNVPAASELQSLAASTLGLPTPSPPASAVAPDVGLRMTPGFGAPHRYSSPPPSLVPAWLYPGPGFPPAASNPDSRLR